MIPETPNGWEAYKLKDITSLITCGLASTPKYVDCNDGVAFLSAQNVRDGKVVLDKYRYISRQVHQALTKNNKPENGDILYSRVGAGFGDAAIIDTDLEFSIYVSLTLIKVNTLCSNTFLKFLLNSWICKKQALLGVFQGGGVQNLNVNVVREFKILLPPLPEQQKIAAILSTWDRAIELTEKLIAAKQRRKQALMQQLLTGKVRFKEFKGKPWKKVRLGTLLKEVKRFVEWDDKAEYHLLSIRRRSGGMFDRETKLGGDIKTKVMMTTEKGDFVIARMQAVHGAITVTPPECHGKHVSGSYSTFVAKDSGILHMPFLNYVSQLPSFYRLLLLSAYGVTIEKMTFNLPWFLHEKIDIPPTLDEQKQIAEVFVAFEYENRLLQQRLQSLKRQKVGLMQQLLLGKIRVYPESPNDK